MSKAVEELYAKWLDAKTTELQQAAQTLIQSDDPETAFREALNQPSQPSDVLEAFGDNVTPEPGPDGPYVEALGRRISRAEAQEVLARWNGPVSGDMRSGDSDPDALNAVMQQWQAEQDRQEEARRTTHDENLRSANANRTGS